ncbi:MAG: TetR/AcrR family transcriptional regulator [Cyanobacteria bacterium]|nr:TetR/AcrR family transcriptional regulator [Cyanobacteriota bacterium]
MNTVNSVNKKNGEGTVEVSITPPKSVDSKSATVKDVSVSIKRSPGRPKNKELTSQRREEILSVATGLFAQYGFASTDVQQIADQLGLAKGTIYHYFGSKEKLFHASVDRGMEGLSVAINDSIKGVDEPIKQIVHAIRGFLSYFDHNPEIIELIVQERSEFRDRKKPTYLEHRERNIQPWNDMFQKLSDEGRFRTLDPEEVTQTISNMLYGTIFTTYFARQGKTFESRAAQIINILLIGIMGEEERARVAEYL